MFRAIRRCVRHFDAVLNDHSKDLSERLWLLFKCTYRFFLVMPPMEHIVRYQHRGIPMPLQALFIPLHFGMTDFQVTTLQPSL